MALHLSRFKGVAVAPPMGNMTAYLENVRVEGGTGEALSVDDGITVSAKNCVFSGTDVGLALNGLSVRSHLMPREAVLRRKTMAVRRLSAARLF